VGHQKKEKQENEFKVGHLFESRANPSVTGTITKIISRVDETYYEMFIQCPGTAPRRVHLSREGVIIKFAQRGGGKGTT
jgi:hypothetical protein